MQRFAKKATTTGRAAPRGARPQAAPLLFSSQISTKTICTKNPYAPRLSPGLGRPFLVLVHMWGFPIPVGSTRHLALLPCPLCSPKETARWFGLVQWPVNLKLAANGSLRVWNPSWRMVPHGNTESTRLKNTNENKLVGNQLAETQLAEAHWLKTIWLKPKPIYVMQSTSVQL